MNKPMINENEQTALFISLASHMAEVIVAERELQSLQQEWVRLDTQEQILQHQLSTFQAIPTL
jgi:Na+-transporting NADH:ubiquinone oxidoreductase subunit NqrC